MEETCMPYMQDGFRWTSGSEWRPGVAATYNGSLASQITQTAQEWRKSTEKSQNWRRTADKGIRSKIMYWFCIELGFRCCIRLRFSSVPSTKCEHRIRCLYGYTTELTCTLLRGMSLCKKLCIQLSRKRKRIHFLSIRSWRDLRH